MEIQRATSCSLKEDVIAGFTLQELSNLDDFITALLGVVCDHVLCPSDYKQDSDSQCTVLMNGVIVGVSIYLWFYRAEKIDLR